MKIKHGDFTGLAEDYSKYRPGYSESVLDMILGRFNNSITELDVADVGAGTGIWTAMLANRKPASIVAIEPNDSMREFGKMKNKNITWAEGSAEQTGLNSNSIDLVSMASSFHWTNQLESLSEFGRILKSGGIFCALWNPRLIAGNRLLEDIENKVKDLKPDIKRVSSGNSGITNNLSEIILGSNIFLDVCYAEATHKINMSPERYIGAWRSVNDLRYQLGEFNFNEFITYITKKVEGLDYIETTYLTRAWSARVNK
jgi:SAM-dependent methyltransferase